MSGADRSKPRHDLYKVSKKGDRPVDTLLTAKRKVLLYRLQQYDKPLEVRAIATDVTYIAGPLKIDLVAVQNGIVVFRTRQQNQGQGDLKVK